MAAAIEEPSRDHMPIIDFGVQAGSGDEEAATSPSTAGVVAAAAASTSTTESNEARKSRTKLKRKSIASPKMEKHVAKDAEPTEDDPSSPLALSGTAQPTNSDPFAGHEKSQKSQQATQQLNVSGQMGSLNTSNKLSSAGGTSPRDPLLYRSMASSPSPTSKRKTSEDLFIEELVGTSSFAAGLDAAAPSGDGGGKSANPADQSQDALQVSRQMYRDRLHALQQQVYTTWGATECRSWPPQNGKTVKVSLIARQVFRGVTSMYVKRHESLILNVFSKSERLERFMNDAFWYTFLEHYALQDGDRLYHHYVLAVKDEIRKEQESWVFRTIERAQREKERREKMMKRQQEKAMKQAEVLNEMKRLTGGAEQRKRMRERMQKKAALKKAENAKAPLSAREVLMQKTKPNETRPLHVLTSREALKIRCPRKSPRTGHNLLDDGGSDLEDDDEESTYFLSSTRTSRANSRAGSPSPSRRPTSAQSVGGESAVSDVSDTESLLTMPDSVMPFDEEDLLHIMSSGRGRVHSRSYQGKITSAAVIKMLLEAEELTPEDVKIAEESSQGIEVFHEMWTKMALSLIRREQDRMFGRMAKEYTELFRSLTRLQKDAFVPSFPDLVSRIVCQVLTRLIPYAKETMNDETRKHIKRRISYWVHGIENMDVEKWHSTNVEDYVNLKDEKELGKSILSMSTQNLNGSGAFSASTNKNIGLLKSNLKGLVKGDHDKNSVFTASINRKKMMAEMAAGSSSQDKHPLGNSSESIDVNCNNNRRRPTAHGSRVNSIFHGTGMSAQQMQFAMAQHQVRQAASMPTGGYNTSRQHKRRSTTFSNGPQLNTHRRSIVRSKMDGSLDNDSFGGFDATVNQLTSQVLPSPPPLHRKSTGAGGGLKSAMRRTSPVSGTQSPPQKSPSPVLPSPPPPGGESPDVLLPPVLGSARREKEPQSPKMKRSVSIVAQPPAADQKPQQSTTSAIPHPPSASSGRGRSGGGIGIRRRPSELPPQNQQQEPSPDASVRSPTDPSTLGGQKHQRTASEGWNLAKSPVKAVVHTVGERGAVTVQMQELAYAEGLAEMRSAFDIVRTGTINKANTVDEYVTGTAGGGADGSIGAGAGAGRRATGTQHSISSSSAAQARLSREAKAQSQRHILSHRFAPQNKKSNLWHEQGRHSTQSALPHAAKNVFSLKSLSPLVRRFMEDQGLDPVLDAGPAELINWSL